MNIDILDIDNKIKQHFLKEYEQLDNYKSEYNDLIQTKKNLSLCENKLSELSKNKLLNQINFLTSKIKSVESKEEYNLYILKTNNLIINYKKILETPLVVSFIKKQDTTKSKIEKQQVIRDYLLVIQYLKIELSFIPDCIPSVEEIKEEKEECKNCKNNSFETTENYKICKECGLQEEINNHVSSYKDADRVNISTKYVYDRKVHFKECMNQYQGKQNCTIEQKVYIDLEKEFQKHHLLLPDDGTKYGKFANITRNHISRFLKELGYKKQYENYILIHYNMTGKQPDNIKDLEDVLLDEFDMIVEMYDKLKNEGKFDHVDMFGLQRTNFISAYAVLYQLLLKHNHKCNKDDFVTLKTTERKNSHNEIIKIIFHHLGFNYHNM